ncbi:hypothetical protein [Algisphaera agarilytica]|uniref:Uncharacterized protein n=1 Tax=Algisphaera agarilytica TaxID=1385975 RepID=A0A7X0H6L2_9BACT|nr:hypothetical protein [Algisphaera agarilytica]MBB6430238.1 hypothetical protein [Algisphaera agarilytica]
MKRFLTTLIGAVALAAVPLAPSTAEDFLTPPDAAWGMVLDPAKVRTSTLAAQVMDHFTVEQRDQLGELIDGASNTLGLNLREDLGKIVAFGEGFAPGDISIAVDIGSAQTNVEGLLLALENYDSYDYSDLIIHSVQSQDKPRFFCAIMPGSETQSGVLLLSPDKTKTEELVDKAKTGQQVINPDILGGDDFFRLWVDRIPAELFEGNPQQSNIAGMIQSLEVVGSTGELDTQLALNITLTNPARARQIYQMAAGGKALIELAAANDADAAKLADLLAYVRVEQPSENSNLLSITAMCDNEGLAAVLDMLDEAGAFDELGLE